MPEEEEDVPTNDTDPDQPVQALKELVVAAPADFWTRIRARVQRREAVRELTAFSCITPGLVLLELCTVIVYVFREAVSQGGKKP